jgi:hypothetical protein
MLPRMQKLTNFLLSSPFCQHFFYYFTKAIHSDSFYQNKDNYFSLVISSAAQTTTPQGNMTDIAKMNMQEMEVAKSSSQVSLGSQRSSQNGKATGGKKKSSSLPNETVEYLKAWMMSPEHIAHPYPTEQEKTQIMAVTGVEMKQLTNWFVNNRKRYWKPRVEARLQQHAHVAAAAAHTHGAYTVPESAFTQANPVSPDPVNKQTVNVHQPSDGFVSIDLCPSPKVKKTLEKPQSLSVVGTGFSRALSTINSVHAISEASSSASVTSSESDCSESSPEEGYASDASEGYDATTGMVTNSEVVDIHILRPLSGKTATLEDVTVLSSVPAERIVTTFDNCAVTFIYPKSERKKVSQKCNSSWI